MIVLLVIACAWLGLLLLGLGMLHVATSTPTPSRIAPKRLAPVGDARIRAAAATPLAVACPPEVRRNDA